MRPQVLSLFSGIGGLDLGFEAAGFDIAAAVEADDACIAQLRRSAPWPVIHGDIHGVASERILEGAGLAEGDAAVLVGGPPCQPFSKAGFWVRGEAGRLGDPRSGTLHAYLRVLRDTLPAAFLLENVEGLDSRGKSEGADLLRRRIEEIGRERGVHYGCQVFKLNAADYGVPQLRERVFVVGARDGSAFEAPPPTHSADGSDGLEPHLTAWDALGDLEEEGDPSLVPRGKWAELLASIPEGENYLWHTERKGGVPLFGWRRRYWSFLLKLAKDRPSWTIPAQPGPATGPFHWKSRRLSARELCRLQTFPDSYPVEGSVTTVQRQLGNAVPSLLAEVLARAMARQFLGLEVEAAPSLLRPRLGPPPPPEPVAPVPAKYLARAGEHAAHPGAGKGPGALAREERST